MFKNLPAYLVDSDTKRQRFTLSEIRDFYKWCDDVEIDDPREALQNILQKELDFFVDDVRFIHNTTARESLCACLFDDPVMTTCFHSDYLAKFIPLKSETIAALCSLENEDMYNILVQYGADIEIVDNLNNPFSRGAHLSGYDGEEHNVIGDYYAYRN